MALDDRLNPQVLAQLRIDGGAVFVADLAGLFARSAPARLAVIGHCVAEGDWAGVARAAHSLRSSAANLGADAVAQAAGALEDATQDQGDVRAAQEAVEAAWSAVADEVRRLAGVSRGL